MKNENFKPYNTVNEPAFSEAAKIYAFRPDDGGIDELPRDRSECGNVFGTGSRAIGVPDEFAKENSALVGGCRVATSPERCLREAYVAALIDRYPSNAGREKRFRRTLGRVARSLCYDYRFGVNFEDCVEKGSDIFLFDYFGDKCSKLRVADKFMNPFSPDEDVYGAREISASGEVSNEPLYEFSVRRDEAEPPMILFGATGDYGKWLIGCESVARAVCFVFSVAFPFP